MTSGIPLDPIEQQYIRDHIQDGPARIAFDLGREFETINGGYRKRDTVKKFIRKIKGGAPLIIEIPSEISMAALEKGITSQQIQFIALRAVLQQVKVKG